MNIVYNGRSYETVADSTIIHLLEQLDLNPRQVAVEVNQQLVPRDHHDQCVLREGDRVEVVTLAGGG